MTPKRISVLVVDEQALLRERVAELIEQDTRLRRAGEAGDCEEGLEKIRQLRPDVVVLDVIMADLSGAELLRVLAAERIEVKVLVLTAGPTVELREALEQRPDSMLYKNAASDEQICEEIVALVSGDWNSPGQVLLREASRVPERRTELTAGELRVLRYCAEGWRAQAIAAELNCSESFVRKQLASARRVLGVSTSAAAVAKAYELGYLSRRD